MFARFPSDNTNDDGREKSFRGVISLVNLKYLVSLD
jgi:hypothetical protein